MAIEVQYRELGTIDYQKAWDLQESIFAESIGRKIALRKEEISPKTENIVLFCEHPHVYTLGKSGHPENLLLNESELVEVKATYYKINRGGDITYHGPGQLVVYPILDLDYFFTDIHKYLRYLEEAVIITLADFGIKSQRLDGFTGVWLDVNGPNPRKICAMGVKCSRWVTMHGIGFNVNTNLDYFKHIVPCGIDDKAVTSMQQELGREVDFGEVRESLKKNLADLFGFQWI
jgi:lipoyl(octanoyl) transferase